jgi:TetR/AcrR family transcriptional regulator
MNHGPREKLLTVATGLFATKGFAAVSIRDLAQAAGVNSALISYYFGGKEGLYGEVLEAQFRCFVETARAAMESDLPTEQKIRQWARALLDFHRTHPCWLRLYFSELSNPTPCLESVVTPYMSQAKEVTTRMIAQGISDGELSPGLDPQFAIVSLAAMLNYFFLVRPIIGPLRSPEEELAAKAMEETYFQQAVDIFLHGVLVRQP